MTPISALETGERVAADVSHTFPALTFVWKRISKAKMQEILDQGRTSLHAASEVLLNEDRRAALQGADIYYELVCALQSLRNEGHDLDQKLKGLKLYQLVARAGTHELVVAWKERTEKSQAYIRLCSSLRVIE
ncbi:hypothetical protein BV20DRAFT_1058107 [Pilatotrama ljubarskyi]|nr:hypothetical protein BV20DRAFT_1058107 [Pilatotrama ljubarskyi]